MVKLSEVMFWENKRYSDFSNDYLEDQDGIVVIFKHILGKQVL
jgi:hypothetical protein